MKINMMTVSTKYNLTLYFAKLPGYNIFDII